VKPFQKTHEHYEALAVIEDTQPGVMQGTVVFTTIDSVTNKGEGVFTPYWGFARSTVAPQAFELLAAAPLMYQQLTLQHACLERMSDLLERLAISDSNPVLRMVEDQKSAILLCQMVAREGLLKVAKQISNEQKGK
jgi:hypothetical protein